MGTVMPLGFKAPGAPIPPIPEHTTYLRAGPLSIGVEYRVLTDEIVEATEGIELAEDRLTGFDSQGVSLHVCDAGTGAEHLRFDCFDGDPHYHYITPGELNWVVVFDPAGHGDMWEWALGCLRSRLPAMLEQAGAGELAGRVDQAAVDAALPEIRRLAARPPAVAGRTS